jgi:hypothetical protein
VPIACTPLFDTAHSAHGNSWLHVTTEMMKQSASNETREVCCFLLGYFRKCKQKDAAGAAKALVE